jgi:hypothetical protein
LIIGFGVVVVAPPPNARVERAPTTVVVVEVVAIVVIETIETIESVVAVHVNERFAQ